MQKLTPEPVGTIRFLIREKKLFRHIGKTKQKPKVRKTITEAKRVALTERSCRGYKKMWSKPLKSQTHLSHSVLPSTITKVKKNDDGKSKFGKEAAEYFVSPIITA